MGFLHPLAPATPKAMTVPATGVSRKEEPRWPTRGIQLHTMHPLELTHLVEGWGPLGPQDEAGWNAMLPEWDRFLEWMLANGQNRVHWVLLEADSWKESSPCYLNHIAPADVGMGEGAVASGADVLRVLLDSPNGTDLAECAAAPSTEPTFPQYGLRTRP